MAEPGKPLPRVTSLTRPFWEAAAQKRLVIQRCTKCEEYVWCPRPACTECGCDQLTWTPVSGRGSVFSFTVIRQVIARGANAFEKEIPYVVAWIDLDEGPRLCSNVVDCPLDQIVIGMPVEVLFEEASPEISLPKFRPQSRTATLP